MKRWPLLILLFLLVAGVGLLVWNASREAQAETFMLADGSVLEYRGFTVGTNHTRCMGNVFQRMAALIPGQLGEKLGGGTVVRHPMISSTNVVFWFRVNKNPSLAQFSLLQREAGGGAHLLFRYRIKDNRGSNVNVRQFGVEHPLPAGDIAKTHYSTNLPSASPTVHLKLSIWRGPEDQEESVEFTAPNPLYRKQP